MLVRYGQDLLTSRWLAAGDCRRPSSLLLGLLCLAMPEPCISFLDLVGLPMSHVNSLGAFVAFPMGPVSSRHSLLKVKKLDEQILLKTDRHSLKITTRRAARFPASDF